MKTCTFQEILNLAANYAARTTAKLPVAEQTLLQAYLATEFETLFTSQCWSFLIPDFVNVTGIVGQQVSLNEGDANEFGDILAILDQNPHTTDYWRHINYSVGDDVIWLDDPIESVWIEALKPYPGTDFPDLAAMTLANFLAATCPRAWKQILARKAAAELLTADSDPAGAGVQMGLAERALSSAVNRFCPTPAWRGFHASPVRRRRMGMPTYQ